MEWAAARKTILRDGFLVTPRTVLHTEGLSHRAKELYTLLFDFAWQSGRAFPGQVRLAAMLGVTDRSIRTYLAELVAAGLLTVRRRGQGQTNIYQLRVEASAGSSDLPPSSAPGPETGTEKISALDRKPASGLTRTLPRLTNVISPSPTPSPLDDDDFHPADESAQSPGKDQQKTHVGVSTGEVRDQAAELQSLVQTVAPRAVPSRAQAAIFVLVCGGLAAATAAVRGAAERHVRTKASDPISSWQFFLAAADHRSAPPLPAPPLVPCDACQGRSLVFDQTGGLVVCASCSGAGRLAQGSDSEIRMPAVRGPVPSPIEGGRVSWVK
ncbi:MAG: helix-turn-helix domain-containing protein [Sulfobacillus sp.]